MAKRGLKSNTPVHTTNAASLLSQGRNQARAQKSGANGAKLNLHTHSPNGRKSVTVMINGVMVQKFI